MDNVREQVFSHSQPNLKLTTNETREEQRISKLWESKNRILESLAISRTKNKTFQSSIFQPDKKNKQANHFPAASWREFYKLRMSQNVQECGTRINTTFKCEESSSYP